MASRKEAFAAWRRERPFWGATLAIAAGLEIYSVAMAPMHVVVMQGLPGLLTIFIALVAVIMGAITLAQPPQRVITGWVILVLGPLSILATNLGGFVIGMILLVVGGSLVLSWEPLGAEVREFDDPVPAEDVSPVAAAGYETETTVADPYESNEANESNEDYSYDDSYQGSHRSSTWADETEADAEPAPVAEPVSRSAFDDYSYSSGTSSSSYSAEPAAPAAAPSAADESDESERPMRNPWRSRIPTPESSELEPPKAQVRSTLLVPLVIAAIAVSGIVAAPAQAAGNAQAGLFDWLIPPAQPAPSASASPSPSATPSASASAGTGGTKIGGITIPGLGGNKADGKSTDGDVAAAANCPDTVTSATQPGAAADKAASELKACTAAQKAAGDTAVKKAAAPDFVVANSSSKLNAKRLTLNGFAYQGTTTVTKANGDTVKVLKMHASKLVVSGMEQSYEFDGHTVLITDPKDDVTIYNVDLYVKKMSGSLFGLIPTTFTPDLPNVQLPALPLQVFITNGVADVALVKAEKITLPSLVSTVD
ncbi:DUF6114 domain-containing protein [Spongisporangium articulatum]|uniref:DUF6114 domain-containing protein n=1 Tax=Spongisporangium articulatum TaxID=3362603 RepID=A0ABW8AMN2_9ACTN